MIDVSSDPLSRALRDPVAATAGTLREWEVLIAQARRANLLGRLAALLEDRGAIDAVPSPARAHLVSALRVAQAHRAWILRELDHLHDALSNCGIDVVLLKGAAYVAAGLPPARGRMFHDVDILVPRDRLPQVEAALMLRGWATTHHNAYDQRYYREWMHELPPMRHVTRGTIVDVHHAILPLTARIRFDGTKLLAAARPVSGDRRFMVLAPADMVLHSAVHFVYNEELGQGLRDLADIDALLAHFGGAESFWRELAERADELGLQRPLFYALRYATRFFDSRVPPAVATGSRGGAPPRGLRAWMDTLFMRALRAGHPYAEDALAPAARLLLYVRAHWLRMPPLLLIRHLTTKALRREPDDRARAPV